MIAAFFIVWFILMMNGLWLYIDDLVGKGLPPSAIFELIFYYSSTMIPLVLPLATLLAALMTMGNMGEFYELTALKAAGVSLVRIIRSIFVLAIFVSIGSFFVINNYVPYSVNQMGKVIADIKNLRQEIKFTDGVFFNGIPNISIRVGTQNKNTKKLDEILIFDNRNREIAKTIIADSGYISISEDKMFMKIDLYNGQSIDDNRDFKWESEPTLTVNTFKYQAMAIKLDGFNFSEGDDNLYEGNSNTKNINELQLDIDSLSVIADEKIVEFQKKFFKSYLYNRDTMIVSRNIEDSIAIRDYKAREKFVITKATTDTLNIQGQKNVYDDASSIIQNLIYYTDSGHSQIATSTITLYRSKGDWHKKLSLPISVFIFFLIGAPLGAIIRRGGIGLPMVICIVFFLIYYILNIMGEKMVRDGVLAPVIGMWLSTFVLAPIALFLTIKSKKESQLLNIEAYINKYKAVKIYFIRIKEKRKNKNNNGKIKRV